MISSRHRPAERGFTLIEMIVVVAIIAALAAILVPIVSSELDDSSRASALAECQRIAFAMTQYIKDARVMPTGPLGNNTVTFLYSRGNAPTANPFDDGTSATLASYLNNGTTNGGSLWNGPYLQDSPIDPWGRFYIVNVHGYYSGEHVWVMSAGPNGSIDTSLTDSTLQSDDVGVMIR
ncbi:MAG: type II secretion system protein GspG [Planctomycetes bacterium]|nr:type II secretion system protein GspG [Planctomycetota bacterium]MBI3845159.1 type II secretion system protein GspG [Planctomycetota bacterium]